MKEINDLANLWLGISKSFGSMFGSGLTDILTALIFIFPIALILWVWALLMDAMLTLFYVAYDAYLNRREKRRGNIIKP